MNTSMIEAKFLSHPEDIGVVAVGFSGGQVWITLLLGCLDAPAYHNLIYSASLVSMPPPPPSSSRVS